MLRRSRSASQATFTLRGHTARVLRRLDHRPRLEQLRARQRSQSSLVGQRLSTRASSGARPLERERRSGDRAARRTGCPTPRTASRRRSSSVKPGIVLSSLTMTSPSSRTKKSTRASPSQSPATNASTARCCTSSIVSCGQLGRDHELHAAVVVLRLVVVPLVLERVDAAGQRRDRGRHAVAEHAALDLDPRTNSSTSTFSSWRRASATAGASSDSSCTFEIPTDEPSRAGLTKTG